MQAFLPEVPSQGWSHRLSHPLLAQAAVGEAWSVQHPHTEGELAAIAPCDPQNVAAAAQAAARSHGVGGEPAFEVSTA